MRKVVILLFAAGLVTGATSITNAADIRTKGL